MTVALEIISPERLLLARPVDMVVIPGTEGDLGILPGHSRLITSLRGGMIDLYENDKVADRYFVSGGFAEVTEERCTVLADAIVKLAELDAQNAADELERAEAQYRTVSDTDEAAWRAASDRLITAQARVDAVAQRG